jgi:hypothetical protein
MIRKGSDFYLIIFALLLKERGLLRVSLQALTASVQLVSKEIFVMAILGAISRRLLSSFTGPHV